jgi:23S rRNA (adenine2503-C2)-methyltransferase
MKIKDVLYLPSGRIFLLDCNGYTIECTEMRDVEVTGSGAARSTTDVHTIWKHLVPYTDKWLLTVSTQYGCVHKCKFCDVADLPFNGNLVQDDIEEQIQILLHNSDYVQQSQKVKIGFARMGEPAHNLTNVLGAIRSLPDISARMGKTYQWLPCFNTILPNRVLGGLTAEDVIEQVMYVKENICDGMLHFQISCNSTDENTRQDLFGGAKTMPINDIISRINTWDITNRTITLNFIVMEGVEIDINKLKKMGINRDRFMVKLIPMNNTINSSKNDLYTYANYDNYHRLIELKDKFISEGIPTIADVTAKCEEAGLCCGQLAQIFQ